MIRMLRHVRIPWGAVAAAAVLGTLAVLGAVAIPDQQPVKVEPGNHQPLLLQSPLEPPTTRTPATAVRAAARGWVAAWLQIRHGADPTTLRRWSTPQFAAYTTQTRPAGVPDSRIDWLRVDSSGETYGVASVKLHNGDRLTLTTVVAPPAGWRVASVAYDKAGGP